MGVGIIIFNLFNKGQKMKQHITSTELGRNTLDNKISRLAPLLGLFCGLSFMYISVAQAVTNINCYYSDPGYKKAQPNVVLNVIFDQASQVTGISLDGTPVEFLQTTDGPKGSAKDISFSGTINKPNDTLPWNSSCTRDWKVAINDEERKMTENGVTRTYYSWAMTSSENHKPIPLICFHEI